MFRKGLNAVRMLIMTIVLTIAVLFLSSVAYAQDGFLGAERLIVEQGLGSSSLLSDSTLEGNIGLDRFAKTRVGLEWELLGDEGLSIDFGLGMQSYMASGQSNATGIDTTMRITLSPNATLSPYVIFSASYDKMSTTWTGTDVDYTFANSFGAGASYKLDDKSRLFVDYRFFHTSNGAAFHTDSFRETFGLETSNQNPGFETGLITVGYSWEF